MSLVSVDKEHWRELLFRRKEIAESDDTLNSLLSIRLHHLHIYLELCQGDNGWNRYTNQKPWELDERERAQIASEVAYHNATEDVTSLLDLLYHASRSENRNTVRYLIDRIGSNPLEAKFVQLKLYLLYRNFLRSLSNPELYFKLDTNPDDYCRTCVGGTDFGKHCKLSAPTEQSRDILTHRLLANVLNPSLVRSLGGHFEVSARGFFILDPSKYLIHSGTKPL